MADSSEDTEIAVGTGEFLVFPAEDGTAQVHVRLHEGTVWLTQRLMAELLGKTVQTINHHLSNIYDEGELDPSATIRKFRIVGTEGNRRVSRLVDHYALPAIIATGYRVRPQRPRTSTALWRTQRRSRIKTLGSRSR